MTDEYIDIKLNDSLELTAAATADAPILRGIDCLLQDIKLEAKCNEGDLWHDLKWGWSLVDFINSEYDKEVIALIENRVRIKLERHIDINQNSIDIMVSLNNELLTIKLRFKTINGVDAGLLINASAIEIEVIER